MLKGVSSFRPNYSNELILSSLGKARTGLTSGIKSEVTRVAQHIDLPAKVSLGLVGAYGIGNIITDSVPAEKYVMSCSDYDSSDMDGESPYSYGVANCNPYP